MAKDYLYQRVGDAAKTISFTDDRQSKSRVSVVSLSVAAALFLWVFSACVFNDGQLLHHAPTHLEPDERSRLSTAMRDLYGPFIPELDAANWTDITGRMFYNHRHTWTEPLGKDVLILDIDSRDSNETGTMRNPETLDWTKVERHTAGMMNHYQYALLHGYDYRFLSPNQTLDRDPRWLKVFGLRHFLLPTKRRESKYRFVIFVDSDALFLNPELPLEWMLNHWNISDAEEHPSTAPALAMAEDEPHANGVVDTHGNRDLNSGFIIAQRHPILRSLFKAWVECPYNKTYPGCAGTRWRNKHEQGAVSSWLRYDDRFSRYLKKLPCSEANGYETPGDWPTCNGTLIQHNWDRKNQISRLISDQLARATFRQVHTQYLTYDRGNDTVRDNVTLHVPNLRPQDAKEYWPKPEEGEPVKSTWKPGQADKEEEIEEDEDDDDLEWELVGMEGGSKH